MQRVLIATLHVLNQLIRLQVSRFNNYGPEGGGEGKGERGGQGCVGGRDAEEEGKELTMQRVLVVTLPVLNQLIRLQIGRFNHSG